MTAPCTVTERSHLFFSENRIFYISKLSVLAVLLDDEGFEEVAFLDIVELLQTDTALVALGDLLDVVLEAAQRLYLILGDDYTVTNNADKSAALDLAGNNLAASDGADVADADSLANLCVSEELFLEYGSEKSLHSCCDLLNALIDYTVGTDVDLLALCRIESNTVGTYVESDNDCV